MAFNGGGVFNRLYSWVMDAANGIKIRADRMDNEMNGMATGLTDCVTRDGQSPALAPIPMGGFNHTNVSDATQPNQYATLGQVQSNSSSFAIGAGTAQAITAAFTPSFTAGQLKDGTTLTVRALLANTAADPTFAPDAIGAQIIKKWGGQSLVPGDIFGPGHDLELTYKTATTSWELLNPALGGDLTINGILTVAGQLIGKGTATNDDAAAGYIGEYGEASQTVAIALADNVLANVISLVLQPGDYDVWGTIACTSAANDLLYTQGSISLVSLTFDNTLGRFASSSSKGATPQAFIHFSPIRTKVATATTQNVFLVVESSTGTANRPQATGILKWRRRR